MMREFFCEILITCAGGFGIAVICTAMHAVWQLLATGRVDPKKILKTFSAVLDCF
jgi:hypothetical protein